MGKIAFLFAGQGSQYVGMGKDLYDNFDICRDIFQIADSELGYSMSNLCFEGPAEALNKTENTQPAVLTVSIAALKILESYGIIPQVTAGLSLGEYSALVCSGALEFKDTVKLVKKRGKFMQEAVPEGVGTMAAVIGLTEEKVMEVCSEASEKGIVEPANFNCPGQIVIAGEMEAVGAACEIAKEKGAMKTVPLSVSGPFHTSMLKPASLNLAKELNNVNINNMGVPVISNVTGEIVKDSDLVKELLIKQVMSPVKWEQGIRKMMDMGIDTFVEIGPGKAISSFVKKIDRKAVALNVESIKSLEKTVKMLTD